jgi:hypothetical protein
MFSGHGRQCEGSKLMLQLCPLFDITKFKIVNQVVNIYLLTYVLTYLITYLLTPKSRVLEKLTGFHIVNNFPAFYRTQWFITAFTSVRQLSLSWATSIQSILPHPIFWRSILILFTHTHTLCEYFVTRYVFTVRSYQLAQISRWSNSPVGYPLLRF